MANLNKWTGFYVDLALKVATYRENVRRQELINIVENLYKETSNPRPEFELGGMSIVDIDPFTVFGLFNLAKQSQEERLGICYYFSQKLSIQSLIPTSLEGVPVLNNNKPLFYNFQGQRGLSDIEDLWGLFVNAVRLAKEESPKWKEKFNNYFNKVIQIKGISYDNLTKALFWINPDYFINLDNANKWYIFDSGNFSDYAVAELPKLESNSLAEIYWQIRNKVNVQLKSLGLGITDFKSLSYEATKEFKNMNGAHVQLNKISTISPSSTEVVSSNRSYILPDLENTTSVVDADVKTRRYWLYSPGEKASKWDEFRNAGIAAIGWDDLGDLKQYKSKSEISQKLTEHGYGENPTNNRLTLWNFANEIKVGDVLFIKKGNTDILGKGIVISPYYFDASRPDFNHTLKVKWTNSGSWPTPFESITKALTDVTDKTAAVEQLLSLIDPDGVLSDDLQKEEVYPDYSKQKFLDEVFMDESQWELLNSLLEEKRNIIIQGAPGVGKTFCAKRLAYSIIGKKDVSRVSMIQFHQSYSYEDFIMGFRPDGQGFKLRTGVFYEFCKKASDDIDNKYFFIIDEINRGNLSKIFGELFMLIEKDWRGEMIRLLYNNEQFSVPKNVYIIGLMNTADRSLALLDYALRRRFSFYELKPAFDSDNFKAKLSKINNNKLDKLIDVIKTLNEEICKDDSLGEGFEIGHSYFSNLDEIGDVAKLESKLNEVVNFDIIPMLKEYWFDDKAKLNLWSDNLKATLK